MLSDEEIAHFVEHGYVTVRRAIDPEVARRITDEVLDDRTGAIDPRDPSTWPARSLDLDTGRELELREIAPRLAGAIDSLVAPHTSRRLQFGQSWKLNAEFLPGPPPPLADPEHSFWHIDTPQPPTTLDGRTDALVCLLLWSDVEPNGGGTRFRPATLPMLVEQLEAAPNGVDVESPDYIERLRPVPDEVLEVTGEAGDVVVTHAFLFHSASRNYGTRVRILENPTVHVSEPLIYSQRHRSPSAVERCVIRRLSRPRLGRGQAVREGAALLIERYPDYLWPERAAFRRRADATERAWVARLDAALLRAWAEERASVGQHDERSDTGTRCEHLVRDLVLDASGVPGALRIDDDPDAAFAALLTGIAGPATRRHIVATCLAACRRELPGAERLEACLAERPAPSPPAPATAERGFDRTLEVRVDHVCAPSTPPRARYRALLDGALGPVSSALCARFARLARDREGLVASLDPASTWVRALFGDGVSSVVAAVHRGRLHLRAQQGGRPRRLVVDVGSPALGNHRAALARVRARLRWAERLRRGQIDPGYRPTPAERAYAALCQWLLGRSGRPPASGIPDVDRFADGIATFEQLEAGDLAPMFERADAGGGDDQGWVAALLLGLSGDVEARRRRFDGAAPLAPAPSTMLAGHLLAALTLEREARRHLLAGLDAAQPRKRADVLLALSQLSEELGEREAAIEEARRAIVSRADDARLIRHGVDQLLSLGAPGDAFLVLEDAVQRFADDGEIALRLGELYAWAGDYERALHWASRGERSDRVRGEKLRAIASYGRGELRDALRRFQRVADGAFRAECELFIAEIHARLGEIELAGPHFDRSRVNTTTAAHTLLAFLLDRSKWGRQLDDTRRYFEPERAAEPPGEDAAAFCLRTLERFRGNRTERLTWAPGTGAVEPAQLRAVSTHDSDLSIRKAASDTIKRIAADSTDDVIAQIDRLADRYPDSPHPHCYRGELMLWLGRYDDALADFDAGQRRRPSRWTFVGRGAVHAIRGAFERARAEFAECARHFEPVPGATTHVYLGEMYRRMGRLEEAARELEHAVAVKPGRVGAWMNLALTRRALGDSDAAKAIFARVLRGMPRILWDAQRALAGASDDPSFRWPVGYGAMVPTFEQALSMMRGNRSSHTISYFDHRGVFRVATDAVRLAETATKKRHLLVEEIVHRVSAGLDR